LCCVFFSSRRRHTRSKRDWSSDVCSSDLPHPLMQSMTRKETSSVRYCTNCRRSVLSSTRYTSKYLQRVKNSKAAPCLYFKTRRRSEERRVGKEYRARRERGEWRQKASRAC